MPYPEERPRRLRRTAALRDMVRETSLETADLVLPLYEELNRAATNGPWAERWRLHNAPALFNPAPIT